MKDAVNPLSILNRLVDEPFTLPQLQDAHKQIRLLEILPELGLKDEICCNMTVRKIDDPSLCYTAISYTWGQPQPRKHIYVGGKPLQVGPNCWYALWQMKNNALTSSKIQKELEVCNLYWMDAICIDQENIAEKSVQVAAMGRIYANATLVAACIGYESHDSPLFDEQFVLRWAALSSRQRDHQRDLIRELVEHLSLRPWFQRLWIVQECIMARNIRVFCGTRWVGWRILRGQIQGAISRNVSKQYMELSSLFKAYDAGRSPAGRLGFPLHKVVQQYVTRECAVLHDKLYGLLSIVSSATRQRLNVNYEFSLFEVLWGYAEAISDHETTGDEAQKRPDAPKFSSIQYSSISTLAEEFMQSKQFREHMDHYWSHRLDSRTKQIGDKGIEEYLDRSLVVFSIPVKGVHCHRIDFEHDNVKAISYSPWVQISSNWAEGSEELSNWNRERVDTGWYGEKPRVIQGLMNIINTDIHNHAMLISINCSDDPEHPGVMQYLLPSGAQSGDYIVPMEDPAKRSYFHLVCRPAKSATAMPLRAEIIGLARLVQEPPDRQAYMPWLRNKHRALIYLRPYDLIAMALLEDTGLQWLAMGGEEEMKMASYVVIETEESKG